VAIDSVEELDPEASVCPREKRRLLPNKNMLAIRFKEEVPPIAKVPDPVRGYRRISGGIR
jgi:hypothetical protein